LIRSRRRNGRHLRIWSAGCSTGEEPYSIAILVSKMIPDFRDWNITILANDINPRALKKAAGAVYGHWSFRDIHPEIQEAFFNQKEDGHFELIPRIREMVTFSYLNLVEDAYPSLVTNTNAMDIIFCRNVLMYFAPELAGKVARNFHRSLVDGGLLIVSPTESSISTFPQFTRVRAPGTILYKKERRQGASDFSCEPFEELKVSFKPAALFVPNHGVAPVPQPPNVQIGSRPQQPDAPLETPISKPGTQTRQDLHREASALYEGGCYPEAVEKAEKMLSQNPSDVKSLALLARIYANWGKLGYALQWCEKAVAAEKLHAGYHYLMATILQELGRTEDAVTSLKRTLYLDPRFILAYVALGNISRKRGKSKESVKHFENALSILNSKRPEDVLPESEGINAQRLTEIIKTMHRAGTGR
jgi:chemotaxis protein methyltransferase CheR